jgi:plastocyanin
VERQSRGRRTRSVLGIVVAISLGVGCAGPVPPSATANGPVSPLTTASGSPAPTVELPPATPSTSWTITAGGEADVYHDRPATVVVSANRPVTIRFLDADVLDHTWTVFDADGATILANLTVAKEGDEATGTFTFSNPGSYAFWCTVAGHKGFGEIGTLIVVP